MCSFQILKIAIPIAGCATTVNEEVGTADETATARHQELGQVAHFVGCSETTDWHSLNHLQIALLARPV